MFFDKLFDAAAPCCHNALKPGPKPAGDPLDEAGGVMVAQEVLTCSFSSATLGGPLLARNAVNVVPDTVLKGCTIRARRWLVLFLSKLPPFLLQHFLSRASCMTCGTCSLHLGWWGVSLAWCLTCSRVLPSQWCTLSPPTCPGPSPWPSCSAADCSAATAPPPQRSLLF